MPLAWIKDGKVLCCSEMCEGCNKKEEYGCIEVDVVPREKTKGMENVRYNLVETCGECRYLKESGEIYFVCTHPESKNRNWNKGRLVVTEYFSDAFCGVHPDCPLPKFDSRRFYRL